MRGSITPGLRMVSLTVPKDWNGNETESDSGEEDSKMHTLGTKTRMGWLWPVVSANSPPEVGRSTQEQVCHYLTPYPKWRQPKESVAINDICPLRDDDKLSEPQFRLDQVIKTYPDEERDVRTINVTMRPRDIKERPLSYIAWDNGSSMVFIQRLALLHSLRYENGSGEAIKWPSLPVPNIKC